MHELKKEVGHISAIPSKRLFLSIIADYDLNRSICELIDNALDIWIRDGRNKPLEILIDLNGEQQTIRISDNAGGVAREQLPFIVGPGQTANLPTEEIIGIFGVGTKRAVVALAQDIRITTRHGEDRTLRVEFDESWLKSEDWELPFYEVDEIAEGTTVIDLQRLRVTVTDEAISQLAEHLQATYAQFLTSDKLTVKVNETRLEPITFDKWAYPPGFEPRRYVGDIKTEDGDAVNVEVTAGLSMESSPAAGEYGVYLYCNDRLITRALKSYEVGFVRGLVGLPHPAISLARIIIYLRGQAQSMPWNSSKSGINPNHVVFVALRDWLVRVVKDYTSLSRRFEGEWSEKVFKHPAGRIVDKEIESFPEARKSYLPPLPKSKPRYGDRLERVNRQVVKKKPWTRGLYEGIVAVDLIFRQRLLQKNRICLILLDSLLEIAFKEYLVNESGGKYSDKQLLALFKNRSHVQKEVSKYLRFKSDTWKKVNYYYILRCKLVHERITVSVADQAIEDYREVVEYVLKKLFRLQFDV